jgi:hypothetical protein
LRASAEESVPPPSASYASRSSIPSTAAHETSAPPSIANRTARPRRDFTSPYYRPASSNDDQNASASSR